MNFSTRNVRLNLRKKILIFHIQKKKKIVSCKKGFLVRQKKCQSPTLLKVKWYAPNEYIYIFIYCICAMLKNKNTLCKWTSLFEKPLFKLQILECFRFCTHYSLIYVLYLINRYGSDHLTFKGRVCSSSKTGIFFTRNKTQIFFFWNYIGAPYRGPTVFYSQGLQPLKSYLFHRAW